ncbi:MAG: class I SAM-dependent methyltransferase [Anaerolineae bacterium]|jgi:hypothetical protein|nr:class I SAM-dependent methyltransferase [Anaerolineae bacterium]
MNLKFQEIAESDLLLQTPFRHDQISQIGAICELHEGMRHLDLVCGKGEWLCHWAREYQIIGVGVDQSELFIEAAKLRADELEVIDQVNFVVDDAAAYPQDYHTFDLVSCIGGSWIGGGLIGALRLMQTALKPKDGWIVIGEPFWHHLPPTEACESLGVIEDTFATLHGTLDRFESLGLTLVEMILADTADQDRYEAQQWLAVDRYLREHQDDQDAAALRQWSAHNRRAYLTYGRKYLGWGLFVLRPAP